MNIDRNPHSRTSRLLLALPVAAIALTLAACSAPAARPSVDKVSDGIYKVFEEQGMSDTITKDVADCLAEKLVDSKVSDESLNYIAKGEDRQKDEADKALVTKVLQDNIEECATAE